MSEVCVTVRIHRDGRVKVHPKQLNPSDAYQFVMALIENKGYEEGQNENDETVWMTDDETIEIRKVPTEDLAQPT